MTTEMKTIDLRLSIRREGACINAYLAKQGTLEGAVLIGSIAAGLAEHDEIFFKRWKALMADGVASAVEHIFGQRPDMREERPAPPHERSGRA